MTEEKNWYAEDAATLGDRIAVAREAAGLTQEWLATQIGVKTAVLEGWENDRKEPRANRLQMLTGLLGISLRWLLTGVGDGPELTDATEVDAEVTDMLSELRALRAHAAQTAVQLGQLEKRMRARLRRS